MTYHNYLNKRQCAYLRGRLFKLWCSFNFRGALRGAHLSQGAISDNVFFDTTCVTQG